MIVSNLTGGLRIQQEIPCSMRALEHFHHTAPVKGGRLELTPAGGRDVPGGKSFALMRADVIFRGFSIQRSCLTVDRTQTYQQLSVRLASAVAFTAASVSPWAQVYQLRIPKADVLLQEAVVVNGVPSNTYKVPTEDVTGTIDLENRTVQLHIVITQTIHFQAGCTEIGCVVDEDGRQVLTADIAGTIILPDVDRDGVPDMDDNCRFTPNPDQSPVATPVITAPANLTVNSCADHDIGAASATDVCDARPVTVTSAAPSTFAGGRNLVTWTAQDAMSRTATRTHVVTVVDTTPPDFTSVPLDLALNNCGPATLGRPTAADDCAGAVTFGSDAPSSFRVGPTVVTWTATDASGNDAMATQTVTVTDTVPPSVECNPDQPAGTYRIVAIDACTSVPAVRLGPYALASGEQIMINHVGRPGVRLVNVVGGTRHFEVGPGEAVIIATDSSGNTASGVCR
jgi:hypothetical protein